MIVKPATRSECMPFIMDRHYAKRVPSFSYSFGLYDADEIIGIVTYGKPPSSPLKKGLAGPHNADKVLELNRLALKYNRKNEASFLVSRSLKMLPRPTIIISFADTDQNHVGYVYQACNFIYCGLSAKRTDWKVKGKEHLHGYTIADEFRGHPNRAKLMKEKYGDDFYLKPRPRKHRYVYILGSRKERKTLLNDLRYEIKEYPK